MGSMTLIPKDLLLQCLPVNCTLIKGENSVIDRMLTVFDRRFTSNSGVLHSLQAFDASLLLD